MYWEIVFWLKPKIIVSLWVSAFTFTSNRLVGSNSLAEYLINMSESDLEALRAQRMSELQAQQVWNEWYKLLLLL